MGWRKTLFGALVVGTVGFTAGRVFSQDAKKEMTEEEQMKAFAEMSAPAEQHKKLAGLVGTWDCEMTHMVKDKPPMVQKGVTTSRAAMNGLYVISEHKSDMGGMPFEGLGIDGYSKEKKKYFTFWADSMGSTPMLMWGTEEGKTVTYDGDLYDCGPMGQFTPRFKVTRDDADHMTFEFWAKMSGAADYAKMMEGKYTRRK